MTAKRQALSDRLLQRLSLLGAFLAVGLLALVLQARSEVPARTTEETLGQTIKDTSARPYVIGARFCTGCHDTPAKRNELCLMTEYLVWEGQDPHRIALDWGAKQDPASWKSEAARRAWAIGEKLGIDDVTTAQACVGCHSVEVPAGTVSESFTPTTEGVTCVACHGAYRDWVLDHQLASDPQWRALDRHAKWARKGMTDLWDPIHRAAVCLSCHLGDPDPASHKNLSHEIYAAGHPPLPGFELTAFSAAEPRHWQEQREKSPAAQARLGFDPIRMEQAELVAAAGLLTLKQTAELLHAQAVESTGKWPEFSRFDCYSCHHELRTPAAGPPWRQRLTPRGTPGRPSGPAWTHGLAELGLLAANPEKVATRTAELRQLLSAVDEALTMRPLGDAKAALRATESLLIWLQGPINDLRARTTAGSGKVIDAAQAFDLLQHVVAKGSAELVDHDTARQLTWAYRTIYHELKRSDHPAVKPNAAPTEAILSELSQSLDLDLGRLVIDDMIANKKPAPRPLIDAFLTERLERQAAYEADWFQSRFQELGRLLPAQ